MDVKKCYKCGITKDWKEFYINQSSKTGLSGMCKECSDLKRNERREKYLLYLKNKRTVEKNKHSYLLRSYNLTVEEYNKLYEIQEGRCLICSKHQSELDKSLCVDHNHQTGEIRGLLCSNCNSALGFLKDNIESVKKALEYLIKYNNT